MPALHWDIYCRVIDNYGDAGVCWRLARNLALRGQQVRLVIDDAAPLAFMAPQGEPGVTVQTWPGAAAEPGDVVIEAFGCDPPEAAVQAMLRRPPVWINLEYLSAEPYVERSHRLPSPQRNGLTKWFFYPGFTAATGGLLREPGLLAQRDGFDVAAWRAARGIAPAAGERVATLFCYPGPRLEQGLQWLTREPTLLLATAALLPHLPQTLPEGLRLHALPWLSQPEFDRLLWASDLNIVRGEDSLVRALWAQRPFVWHAYPQDDGAHGPKIEALLQRLALPAPVAAVWRAWNGLAAAPATWPDMPPWAAAVHDAAQALAAQPDLVTQLMGFVAARRG